MVKSEAQSGGTPARIHQQPQNPFAQRPVFDPLFSQSVLFHPQFHLMTPQQQQMLLFQHHLAMQQIAQQSINQQMLLQSQVQCQGQTVAPKINSSQNQPAG